MKKTILVTGGAGHVGSHVIEELVSDTRNQVISLDNYFNGSRKNHIPGAEYRRGHTKNINALVPETPDIVYHLGEYARISTSFKEIVQVYDLNVVGTFAVAEFCRERKVPKLVYAASSTRFAVEGDGKHQSPYAFTKATNVSLIKDFDRWFGLSYAICYFYNAYGPRERGDSDHATVIGRFENAYLNNQPLTVVKPGTQRRNFTYVKDLARGIVLTGERGAGDGYTLPNSKSYSILEIAKAFGGKIEMIDGEPGRAASGKAPSRAHDELGWRTTVDVMDYIRDFIRANPR